LLFAARTFADEVLDSHHCRRTSEMSVLCARGFRMKDLAWLLLVLAASLSAWGCRRIQPPSIDPGTAAAQAMAEYDQNKDGFLDGMELARCPGLRSALPELDKDKDGKLSRAELEAALEGLAEGKVGLLAVRCTARLDNMPLVGATVTFEPEPFLAGKIKPATGTTDKDGSAPMKTEGAAITGCQVGVYRVRISLRGPDGKESVPERYNAKSELGVFISPRDRGLHTFSLSSR
jgi:hypothetical protein